MSPPTPLPLLFLLLTLLVFTPTHTTQTKTSDLLSELTHLRSTSPTTIIRLTDTLLTQILSLPTPRPFSLLIFFDAAQLHSKTELHLPQLKSEFSLLSSSYLTNHPNNPNPSPLFFCDIEFKDSQTSFHLFGINSLPHARFLAASAKTAKDSIPMDQSDFSNMADSMSAFVSRVANIEVGPLHRPPVLSGKQVAFILACLAILAPFAIKKIITGETILHDYKVYLMGAIVVYFISVSGTMHNIIRKMPMFIQDRNDPSKLVYFYQGSGMQLGAEGFAVGSLFTVVGLLLGFVTHGLVKVRNLGVQRVLMVFALVVSFWAVKKVVFLDNWKTGYGIHAYWPSSW